MGGRLGTARVADRRGRTRQYRDDKRREVKSAGLWSYDGEKVRLLFFFFLIGLLNARLLEVYLGASLLSSNG